MATAITVQADRTPIRVIAAAITVLLLGVLGASPSAWSQQIYKYEDEKGRVVYSDKPPPEETDYAVEEVRVKPLNSSGPSPQQNYSFPKRENSREPIRYQTQITSPSDETTIPLGPGNFSVSASAQPSLRGGETLQLILDGSPVGEPGRSANWQLEGVYRGEHKLAVQRLDRTGKVIDTSEPITVYVFRPMVRR